jgi:hypothetical protein
MHADCQEVICWLSGLSAAGDWERYTFFRKASRGNLMANREAVVIWLEGIEGGTGHFGVDLTLSSGINPCRPIGNPPQPSIWLPYCCGSSYRWCPRYGTTDSPQLPQEIVVTNFTPDGKQTNFASNLVRYDVEVYSYNADGQESIYPTHMAVRFDGTSFSPIDSKTPSTYYTTHWGRVRLKEIDDRKGRENYALYNGYITHQGQRVYDYTLGVILWGQEPPMTVQSMVEHCMDTNMEGTRIVLEFLRIQVIGRVVHCCLGITTLSST